MRKRTIIILLFILAIFVYISSAFGSEDVFEVFARSEINPIYEKIKKENNLEDIVSFIEYLEKLTTLPEKAKYAVCIGSVAVSIKTEKGNDYVSPIYLYIFDKYKENKFDGVHLIFRNKEILKFFVKKTKAFPKKLDTSCEDTAKKYNLRLYNIWENTINPNMPYEFYLEKGYSQDDIKNNLIITTVISPAVEKRPELEKKFYFPASLKLNLQTYYEFIDQIFLWIKKEEDILKNL